MSHYIIKQSISPRTNRPFYTVQQVYESITIPIAGVYETREDAATRINHLTKLANKDSVK